MRISRTRSQHGKKKTLKNLGEEPSFALVRTSERGGRTQKKKDSERGDAGGTRPPETQWKVIGGKGEKGKAEMSSTPLVKKNRGRKEIRMGELRPGEGRDPVCRKREVKMKKISSRVTSAT